MTEQLTLCLDRRHHHGGSIENSQRLRDLVAVLAGGRWWTTLELQEYTGSMATSTDIADLRKDGHVIECEYQGKSANGRKVYKYRMIS